MKPLTPYFEAGSGLPETPDALDQRGVIGGAGADPPDAVWRQAYDLARTALEMPGIVVVLGPAGVSGTFLRELMAALRDRGRAVTFVPRADFVRLWPASSALVIEDAAQMDVVRLEAICRPLGRRIVLAGLPASALAELPAPLTPAPLTVVTLEPLSSGTAAAPRTSMSSARVAIASGMFAATSVAGALLWTRAPSAPPEPAPSASEQPGDARPDPPSGDEPAPPQLQAEPSPVPDSRKALNLPPAAATALPLLDEVSRTTPPAPAALPEARPNCMARRRHIELADLFLKRHRREELVDPSHASRPVLRSCRRNASA